MSTALKLPQTETSEIKTMMFEVDYSVGNTLFSLIYQENLEFLVTALAKNDWSATMETNS